MELNKSKIKNISYCAIFLGITATVFYFLRESALLVVLKFIIFPGVLFVFSGALFFDWFERKAYAQMQNRVGPRFYQPIYDAIKLLVKEDITPNGIDSTEFNLIPPFQLVVAILFAFFTPIYIAEGLISFEGDLLFLLFLLSIIAGSVFLLGWSSNNPYGLLGGSRAAISELSLEIPLAIAFIGPAILAGSIRLSNLSQSKFNLIDIPLNVVFQTNGFTILHFLYIFPLSILFYIAILSSNAILEKVPFDPAHADVEIVSGWTIELSGKKLLFTRLTNFILKFALAGIIAAVFLGGPGFSPLNEILDGVLIIGNWDLFFYVFNIVTYLLKTTLVIFLIAISRTVLSRLRIDQLVSYFWQNYLPFSFLSLLTIIILRGVFVI